MSDPSEFRRRHVLVVFQATETDTQYSYEVEGPGSDRVLSMYAWAQHGREGKEDVDFQNPTVLDLGDAELGAVSDGSEAATASASRTDRRNSEPEPDR